MEAKKEEQKTSRDIYKDYGSYYDKPRDKKGEGFGIASLVMGGLGIIGVFIPVIGVIPSLLAIIFGILGLKAIKRGFAIAGLALGITSTLPQIFLIALLISKDMPLF